MLHSTSQTILADNGVQVFANCDIELILNMAFDYEYTSGSRRNRYSDQEVCEHFDISLSELNRMKDLLSADACYDKNGKYKF